MLGVKKQAAIAAIGVITWNRKTVLNWEDNKENELDFKNRNLK